MTKKSEVILSVNPGEPYRAHRVQKEPSRCRYSSIPSGKSVESQTCARRVSAFEEIQRDEFSIYIILERDYATSIC